MDSNHTSTPTLASLLNHYFEVKLLADETKLRYDLTTRNLTRYIGGITADPSDISLASVDVAAVVGFRKWSLERMRPTSFNTERRHLSALLNLAVRLKWITSNPFREVERAPVHALIPKSIPKPVLQDAINLLERGRRVDRFGRQHELISPQWFWLAVLKVFYFTGMRKRQLVGLTWQDLDFQSKTIRLSAATSKTRREWLIPLPCAVSDDLELLRRRTLEIKGCTPLEAQVFCLPMFSARARSFALRTMNSDNVDSFFQRLRKLMPRDSPRISAHKIRHTTATQLANRVKNLKVVQQQLGHSSILTTYCYVHPDMESMREAIAGL